MRCCALDILRYAQNLYHAKSPYRAMPSASASSYDANANHHMHTSFNVLYRPTIPNLLINVRVPYHYC